MNYPAAATVEINGTTYLLDHYSNGQFAIGKKKATELYETVKRFGLRVKIEKDVFIILYTQLRELARFVPVWFLNDLEKNAVREIRPAPSLDLEAVRRVLEDVAKIARIVIGLRRGREYIRIIPHDKSKVWEIVAMLKMVGIRTTIQRPRYYILIIEQNSVEAIRKVMAHFFLPCLHRVFKISICNQSRVYK